MEKNKKLHLCTTFLLTLFPAILNHHAIAKQSNNNKDVRCLRGIAKSNHNLHWNFNHSICTFGGVSCYEQDRILDLNLSSTSLSGSILPSLRYCTFVYTLDLSNNNLSGSIPPDLCSWLPNLARIDLSNNQLTGPVPAELVMCPFLTALVLRNNNLNGSIPASLAELHHLEVLDVSKNQLCGIVPATLSDKFGSSAFDGNYGHCGQSRIGKNIAAIVAEVTAGVVGSVMGISFTWFLFKSRNSWRLAGAELKLISFGRRSVMFVVVCGLVGGVIGVIIASRY